MKKIFIKSLLTVLLIAGINSIALAQCTGTFNFPAAPPATPTSANPGPINISTCSWGGDFTDIALECGATYEFTITNNYHISLSDITATTFYVIGTSSVSFTAPASATYRLHWYVNAACATATACQTTTMELTAAGPPPPVITASAAPTTICAGDTSMLMASGADTYVWNPGMLMGAAQSVTPTMTTTYTVTATDTMSGCISMDSVMVTVPAPVTASATPTTICTGDTSMLMASGANTYVWNPGMLMGAAQSVTPTMTTTYTVTATDTNGCMSMDSVMVTVTPLPVITASATPTTICAGDTSMLMASGANTYVWNPGMLMGAAQSVAPTMTTTYTVTATNTNGCMSMDSVMVTVTPLPVITASATPTTICDGDTSMLMASGADTYVWNPGMLMGAAQSVTPTMTTTYTVTATDTNGCMSMDSVMVTIAAPVTASATPTTICAGDTSMLMASGANTYVWNPGMLMGAAQSVTPTMTTTYTVTATDTNGCMSMDSVMVTVTPLPVITASATPTTICAGDTSMLMASGADTYVWNPGMLMGAAQSVTPTMTTTYTVTATDTNGCMSMDSVMVTIAAPVITASATPTTICDGDTSMLMASGADTYVWNPGMLMGAAQSVTPTMTTTYTVTATDTNGCMSMDSVMVTVTPLPIITASATPTTICAGDTSMLMASGADTYVWNPGMLMGAAQSVTPTMTTTYTVTATDTNGCMSMDSVMVTVTPTPVITVSATPSASVCTGDTVTLMSGALATDSVTWNMVTTAGADTVLAPAVAGNYIVMAWDSTGTCSATDSIMVMVNTPLAFDSIVASTAPFCEGDTATIQAYPGVVSAYCPSFPSSAADTKIDTVSFAGVTTGSPAGNEDYTDNTGIIIPVTAGSTYPLFVRNGTAGGAFGSHTLFTYIDYNQNGIFEGSELIYTFATGGSAVNTIPVTNITIPATATNGQTRMRVILHENATWTGQPCGTYNPAGASWGETEDYTIDVSGGSPATPSFTGISWSPTTNLSPTTGDSLSAIGLTVTTTYVATGTDMNGCMSMDSVMITVTPAPTITASATPATICAGDTSMLMASGADTYVWNPGMLMGAAQSVAPTVTTAYTVTATDTMTGCSADSSVMVMVNPLPTLTVTVDSNETCPGAMNGGATAMSPGAPIVIFSEGFETYSGPTSTQANLASLPGLTSGSWSYTTSTAQGRMRIPAGGAYARTGSNAVTLDANPSGAFPDPVNYLIVEADLSAQAGNSLTFSFWWMDHGDESDADDRVWVRGSNTDTWIEAFNWEAVNPPFGVYQNIQLNLDSILTANSQAVSTTTGIRFGQADNFQSTSITGSDGFTVDDIEITTPSSNSILWSTTDTTNSITGLTAGTYTVTATNTATGCMATDSAVIMTMGAYPTLTASATPSASVCTGDTVTLMSGALATDSVTWNMVTTAGADTVLAPAVAGNYIVMAWDSTGTCSATDSIMVMVNTPLAFDSIVASTAPFCEGDTATIQAYPGVVSAYCPSFPSSAADTKIDTVSFAGVTTGSPAGNEDYTDNTGIIIPVTAGSTYPLFVRNGTAGGAFGSHTLFTYIDYNQNGIFEGSELIYTFATGGSAVNTIPVTNITIPATATNGQTRMRVILHENATWTGQPCGTYNPAGASWGETEDYTIDVSGGSPATPSFTGISWSPTTNLSPTTGDSLSAIGLTVTTTYVATGTDMNGCMSMDSVMITVTPAPTITASATPATICAGDTSMLMASGADTYVWNPGMLMGAAQSVAPTVTTAYTVTATDTMTGCSADSSVMVMVNPLPTLTVTVDSNETCPGAMNGGATAMSPGAPIVIFSEGFETYSGPTSTQANLASLPGLTSGSWSYTTSTAQGRMRIPAGGAYARTGSNAVTLDANPSGAFPDPVNYLIVEADLSAQAGNSLTFSFWWMDHGDESDADDRVWVRGSNTDTWIEAFNWEAVNPPFGVYQNIQLNLDSILTANSQAVSTTTGIRFGQADNFQSTSITGSDGFTVDDIEITTPSSNSILWSTTDTTNSITGLTAGTYTVTATNTATGCMATDSAVITSNLTPMVTVTPTPGVNNCLGGSVDLVAMGAQTYLWMPGSATGDTLSVPAYTGSNTYTVTGTDTNGCTDTASVVVTQTIPNGDLTQATSGNTASNPGTQSDGFSHPNNGLMYSYFDTTCAIIASVQEAAGGVDLGYVTTSATIDATVPVHNTQPFVPRWFQITPTNQGAASVTLYVTQDDFDDYNGNSAGWPSLPTGPADAAGIANLRITKNDDGGLGVNPIVITPSGVSWNASTMRWEVTFNTPSFSQFRLHALNPGNVALSVDYKTFTVTKQSTSDLVEWTTNSELSSKHFNVQRSADGTNFETLGTVQSKSVNGASTSELNYSFVDESPQIGDNYYRLEQVDIDNKMNYTKNINIIWGAEGSVVSIYPNPAKDILNIDLSTSKVSQTEIKLLDMSGRVVKSVLAQTSKGLNHITLEISNVANGIYGIQVYENNKLTHVGKVRKN